MADKNKGPEMKKGTFSRLMNIYLRIIPGRS